MDPYEPWCVEVRERLSMGEAVRSASMINELRIVDLRLDPSYCKDWVDRCSWCGIWHVRFRDELRTRPVMLLNVHTNKVDMQNTRGEEQNVGRKKDYRTKVTQTKWRLPNGCTQQCSSADCGLADALMMRPRRRHYLFQLWHGEPRAAVRVTNKCALLAQLKHCTSDLRIAE